MVTVWLWGLVGAVLLIGVIIAVIMVSNAFRNRIITEEIILKSLPDVFDGFRILFITDIHRRRLPSALLNPLKGKVDVVLLGGDLTEKNSPLDRLADNMTLVTSIAPTYVVHGNHDYRADISWVDQIINGSGAKLLMDENVRIEREGASLWLTGVDFPEKGGKTSYRPFPRLTMPNALDVTCRIILVHDPLWLSIQKSVPADLILAGHTHGGQVILPFLGRRHVENFYHKYDAGMFQWPRRDGTGMEAKLLISRGFGTSHLPIRWGSPAEMHVLTLRKEKE
ncbi:metallophosphoesterase [Paenibacillus odorifer]|uniref:metallophosphoesterase n=1 Tax=Paenibacillus odorifer TaxID=189426 RepID=UPI0009D6C2DC|nr:metallophosphoesterase [Paenibacillus odorifer]